MCSGAEAVDGACKIARKWAYVKKGVPTDKAVILTADSCYHGMTLSTMNMTDIMLESKGAPLLWDTSDFTHCHLQILDSTYQT